MNPWKHHRGSTVHQQDSPFRVVRTHAIGMCAVGRGAHAHGTAVLPCLLGIAAIMFGLFGDLHRFLQPQCLQEKLNLSMP